MAAHGWGRQGLRRIAGAVLATGLLVAGVALPAGAQEVRPYRPAFDVSNYDIAIELPDSGSIVHAKATITVARHGAADTLRLDLLDLQVNSVAVDGRPVRFVQGPGTIAIRLPSSRRRDQVYRVAVDYGGAVQDGLIARTDSAGRWTYFGDNWPNRARHWIPSVDHPSDKATVTWRVTAPSSLTVVANGALVSARPLRGARSGRTETVWKESKRIPVYLMVIAAAPLDRIELGDTACGLAESQRCVPQAVYAVAGQRDWLPGPFARAGAIVQLFAHLVGPFPYEKLAHVQSSTRFGGMENASEIFYADGAFRRRTMNEGLIAHETAHQWFGDAVTEREWAHVWLSEGFATYFAALWTRAARGDSAFRAQLAGIRATVLADTTAVTHRPVIDTAQTNYLALLNRNSYEKGGFVLQMLRAQVGEGDFFDALREYYREHRHSTALTDDLQAAMEHTSGQRLGWFFDQWLRRPGYPEVTVAWRYDTTAREAVIEGRQSGRFGLFRFPLAVDVVDSTGTAHRATLAFTEQNGAAAPVRIPLAGAPARVVLDPDVELLARLTATRVDQR